MSILTTTNPYLKFAEELSPSGKTKVVWVGSISSGDPLGVIKWYGPWRQYTFFPEVGTTFNKGCMESIIEVIDELMKERRNADTSSN